MSEKLIRQSRSGFNLTDAFLVVILLATVSATLLISYKIGNDGFETVRDAVGTSRCGEAFAKTREVAEKEAGRPIQDYGLSVANRRLADELASIEWAASTSPDSVPRELYLWTDVEVSETDGYCYVRPGLVPEYAVKVPSEGSWATGERLGVLVEYFRMVRYGAKNRPPETLSSDEVSKAFGASWTSLTGGTR